LFSVTVHGNSSSYAYSTRLKQHYITAFT